MQPTQMPFSMPTIQNDQIQALGRAYQVKRARLNAKRPSFLDHFKTHYSEHDEVAHFLASFSDEVVADNALGHRVAKSNYASHFDTCPPAWKWYSLAQQVGKCRTMDTKVAIGIFDFFNAAFTTERWVGGRSALQWDIYCKKPPHLVARGMIRLVYDRCCAIVNRKKLQAKAKHQLARKTVIELRDVSSL